VSGSIAELVPTSPNAHPDKPDLILVNRAAGGGRGARALPLLQEFAVRKGWAADFCLTESKETLALQARSAVREGRERILVVGGDGTFQVLLNALAGCPQVVLGIIPSGGGNDLAAALGLPLDPVRATELLLEGEVCLLDTARVRTADGTERLCMGGAGVGLDAEAARYASGPYRNLRGRSRYLLSAIRALMGFRAIRVRATMQPGNFPPLDERALLLGVLNTPSYGGGLRIAPQASLDDGKLDLVLLEDLGFLEILAILPALAVSGELYTKRIQRFRVEHVRIETERPFPFHGDGEIIGMTPVEIEVVPHAVRILCPRRRVHSL
jgi:diacylglycerol kinase (ATP)